MPQKITTIVRRTKRSKRKSNRIIKRVVIKKKKSRNRKTRNRTGLSNLHDEMLLVANPCHGPISKTVGSGAITERVRTTVSEPGYATSLNGYAVWFPSYHNGGFTVNSSNLFVFENASASTKPVNTAANPFGLVDLATTGVSQSDPGYATTNSATFSRGKTHSACIQLDYVGKLSDISGQVAIIKNLPLRGLFSNKSTSTLDPPSVDTLFAFAAERERMQPTGHEVIWRPTDESSIYRTSGNDRVSALTPDTAWANGVLASAPSTLSATDADEMYGICIAWRGVPGVVGCLVLNFVKVLSLELAPSGASIESPVIDNTPSFSNPMSTITSWLDKFTPGWQSTAINTTANVSGLLAKAYAPKALSLMTNGLRGRGRLLLNDL